MLFPQQTVVHGGGVSIYIYIYPCFVNILDAISEGFLIQKREVREARYANVSFVLHRNSSKIP